MGAAGTGPAKRWAAPECEKPGRWQPHILSGVPRRVVSAARPGWTRAAPVVTWVLRSARIGAAGVFITQLKLHDTACPV
ncbi:hypothetical protein OKW43_003126 [Paraburkholderia sp. WC7.3g]